MRVFVALELPGEVRHAIETFQKRMRVACPAARWTRPEGIHLTLKFIGEASPDHLERIRGELGHVHSARSVECVFRDVGFFPSEQRPRVFWIGVHGTANLGDLAAQIETRLERLGIPREARAFHPHLTLARFDSPSGLDALRAEIAATKPHEFGKLRAPEFHLYQSHLKPGGAEYTILARFPFVKAGG